MILIKNLRNEKPHYPWQIKVDRSSLLGNPFPISKDQDRNTVCDRYKAYIKEKIKTDVVFSSCINGLISLHNSYGKLELFCWCTPLRCHAEELKTILEELIEKGA